MHSSRENEVNADLKPARVVVAAALPSPGHLVIVHKGEQYRLRITRNEKLILTK
jgi:hemin uptake protein HemP